MNDKPHCATEREAYDCSECLRVKLVEVESQNFKLREAIRVWLSDRRAFERAWEEKKKAGYQYGRDALEGVRFGFQIAKDSLRKALEGAST
jgi:hypothetical protein